MKDFEQDYIERELSRLEEDLDEPVALYVVGGAAMAFRGQKTGTKDIDVVLTTEADALVLIDALQANGYAAPEELAEPYEQMNARRVLENADGFRWDVFVGEVLGFDFSHRMIDRAETWTDEGNLTVYAAAPEDLFAFKALTDRHRDREDMAEIYADGIDIDVVRDEVRAQAENPPGKRFAAFFYPGLQEFVEETGASLPGMDEFQALYERELLADHLESRLEDGPVDLASFSEEEGFAMERVREAAKRLERQGLARIEDGRLVAGGEKREGGTRA